ncbi:hypothetical protein SAFG77S_05903 [Streptomyces afghaniensis]
MIGEVQLEGRHTRQGPGGRPDLGREVRQRRQVVAERRGLRGETVTGELHTVTRVPREPDDHSVEATNVLRARRFALLSYDCFVGLLRWATDLAGH